MPESLYIIDVFSLLFQVYHAIPPMTGPAGQPTNALYGFTRDLIQLLQQQKPDHVLCAFDSEGDGVRKDWYEQYKANRTEMPQDLTPQLAPLVEIIDAFDFPVMSLSGWEADDIIATTSRLGAEQGLDVVIVSTDKDCRQLLGERVRMFNCRKKTFFTVDDLKETWGVTPEQVVDFQGMVGDSVDNVPGVPLIGPKKATALIDQFGSLENILANADQAPGKKLRENLMTYADQALLSRKLATLNQHLDLEFDLEKLKVTHVNGGRLKELFREFGFRGFPQEILKLPVPAIGIDTAEDIPEEDPKRPGERQLGLFNDDGQPAKPSSGRAALPKRVVSTTPEKIDFPAEWNPPKREWKILSDAIELPEFFETLAQQEVICLDLETTSVKGMEAEIVGWAISWQPGMGYYLPVKGPEGSDLCDAEEVLATIKPILESSSVTWVNQNIKYDLLILKQHGIHPANIGVDSMIAHYLIDAGARSHKLDTIADEYLGQTTIPITDLIGKGKKQISIDQVDVQKAGEYASEDADLTLRLVKVLEKQLNEQKLWDLYWDLERPLIEILCDMESTGIRIDPEELFQQGRDLGARLEDLKSELVTLAGREFNFDSPKQLREVLFEELQLPVQKKTKTGPSTDQSVLEKLAPLHPLPAKIIEYRQLAKLKSTYLDALPQLIHTETGRIHASFNQVVAATGRLSSSDPNLQNIPIRTQEGRQIRKAFLPEDGWTLVCADYSQIELRMLAEFSQDEALQLAFQQDLDIHSAVAAQIFEIDEAEVSKDQRRIAKAVNFGIVYGQSPYGLAEALQIPQGQAAEFIDDYFSQYPGVERFMEQTLEECVATGYAYTILGRRRPIQGIKNTKGRIRNMPERTAINTVVQGSAADLIKKAMIQVASRLKQENSPARMLLQIHDELVFECPEDHLKEFVPMIKQEMETALELKVPIVVDVSTGPNWLETQPYEV